MKLGNLFETMVASFTQCRPTVLLLTLTAASALLSSCTESPAGDEAHLIALDGSAFANDSLSNTAREASPMGIRGISDNNSDSPKVADAVLDIVLPNKEGEIEFKTKDAILRVKVLKIPIELLSEDSRIDARKAAIEFGSVPRGDSKTIKLVVRNKSEKPRDIKLSFTGPRAELFTVVPESLTLMAGEGTKVDLTYHPAELGLDKANLALRLSNPSGDDPKRNITIARVSGLATLGGKFKDFPMPYSPTYKNGVSSILEHAGKLYFANHPKQPPYSTCHLPQEVYVRNTDDFTSAWEKVPGAPNYPSGKLALIQLNGGVGVVTRVGWCSAGGDPLENLIVDQLPVAGKPLAHLINSEREGAELTDYVSNDKYTVIAWMEGRYTPSPPYRFTGFSAGSPIDLPHPIQPIDGPLGPIYESAYYSSLSLALKENSLFASFRAPGLNLLSLNLAGQNVAWQPEALPEGVGGSTEYSASKVVLTDKSKLLMLQRPSTFPGGSWPVARLSGYLGVGADKWVQVLNESENLFLAEDNIGGVPEVFQVGSLTFLLAANETAIRRPVRELLVFNGDPVNPRWHPVAQGADLYPPNNEGGWLAYIDSERRLYFVIVDADKNQFIRRVE